MSTPFQQVERFGELTTPLGENKLVLVEMTGTEEISSPFEFNITALCHQEPDESLDFDAALGQTCTVRVATLKDGDRHFAGTLVEAARIGPADEGVYYSLKLRPWFWLLTQRVNSRIFNEMTLEGIIQTVLGKYGFADFTTSITASDTIEYCVQHRESDFAFLSRLMEKYGVSYFFKFGENRQTMAIVSDRSGFVAAPGASRHYYPQLSGPSTDEYIHDWVAERSFRTGKVALNDYDFQSPNANMVTEKEAGAGYSPNNLEDFDHPGGYTNTGLGLAFATAKIDSIQAGDKRFRAQGNCAGLSAGMTVALENHPDAGEYLVLRARHHLVNEDYRSGATGTPEAYAGDYELMSADRPFAPAQVTPRPFIAGPQTAIVTRDLDDDPEGQGRIKVVFHWDKGSGRNSDTSMWCRVAEFWGGRTWGTQFIPRLGMEVLVHFIDGDPDRPVVVGSLYNGDNQHPFEFQYTSGIRTELKNELSFEDKAGSELIKIHGERDLKATLRNDVLIEADHQITLRVGSSEIVMDTRSITIKAESIKVEAAMDIKTKGGATANHESGGAMVIKAAIVKIN